MHGELARLGAHVRTDGAAHGKSVMIEATLLPPFVSAGATAMNWLAAQ
jgi:hypothetical protein